MINILAVASVQSADDAALVPIKPEQSELSAIIQAAFAEHLAPVIAEPATIEKPKIAEKNEVIDRNDVDVSGSEPLPVAEQSPEAKPSPTYVSAEGGTFFSYSLFVQNK